jgi:uncharacterized lipoprotein YmbA
MKVLQNLKKYLKYIIFGYLFSGCEYSKIHYYSILNLKDNLDKKNINKSIKQEEIGVETVKISKALNRPQIVFKVSENELKFEETYQWGGNFQEEITQFVIKELREKNQQYVIYKYPSENRSQPKYQWYGEIQQFYGKLGGEILFDGNCRIFDKNSQNVKLEKYISLKKATKNNSIDNYIETQRELLSEWINSCLLKD